MHVFLYFEGYLEPSKTIKIWQKILDQTVTSHFWGVIKNCWKTQKNLFYTVVLFQWEVSSSFKNHLKLSKNVKKPYSIQLFHVFEGLSKTINKSQKTLKFTLICIFWGIYSSSKIIKNCQKMPRTLKYTVISRFCGVIKNRQKISNTL